MPEILDEFNVLTAMPFQELDITKIQSDKCQTINEQLMKFYYERSKATTTVQNKRQIPIDYFTVR